MRHEIDVATYSFPMPLADWVVLYLKARAKGSSARIAGISTKT